MGRFAIINKWKLSKKQKPKLIFFDLDGTLVDGFEYIYQHLWEYFGVEREQTRDVLKSYLRGEITYEQWVDNDVRLLKKAGATRTRILEAIKSLKPMNGAIDVLRQLRDKNYKIIVSGSMNLVIEAVFPNDMNLFDEIFINQYFFDKEGMITHAVPTRYDMEQKATCITDTAKKI